ncbi:methylenetetrahydrofolate reductase [NAD(P)H] [Slackia faecicanis]|uniref:Methylenetetrahydrofolate reductase n=1 Tax=Slackia faecicanis TaxID=255723 RepID=A0A3N0AF65_9ACTN|nr:methylenetetrahydrofolate reductase [Slackia faecicanis]RNL19836.1 methylenetetrahydrofolate reductase [NAD(P)H] [Slackia faecicanis]
MQISQVFERDGLPVSFEIFPPKGELPVEAAHALAAELSMLDPAFVSVTYSAGGSGNSERTIDVARMAKDDFDLAMMAHLTCMGATKNDVHQVLAAMRAAGIENVLALRGDSVEGVSTADFHFAKDLIPVAREAGFCVGAAAYPEGHIECLDFDESIRHLRQKQDAGAQFFVTQLFFDNACALRFLDAALNAGVTVPITFGIMPFLSKAQISRMVFMCGASLPSPIIKLLARYENDPASLRAAGIEYACEQLEGLAAEGVDGLHIYTMNQPAIAAAAMEALRASGAVV